MKPEVVYRGRQLRSSLIWLVLAFFLGGSCLAVYFTMPNPKPAALVLAIVLGLPLFAMSMVELGKSTGLILNPATRQLKFVQGFFARRKSSVHSYDDVRGVTLLHRYHPGQKQSLEAAWSIRIDVERNESLILEEWSHEEAVRRARYLGTTFGIQPSLDGEPVRPAISAPPAPSRDGTARATRPPAPNPPRKA